MYMPTPQTTTKAATKKTAVAPLSHTSSVNARRNHLSVRGLMAGTNGCGICTHVTVATGSTGGRYPGTAACCCRASARARWN